MMGRDFTKIVDECLHRLDRGEDLPGVLADHPLYADRLKPLLLVAMASRAIEPPAPNQIAHQMGKNQMLAEMDQMGSPAYYKDQLGYSRLKTWLQTLLNTSRSRTLIGPLPGYRMAAAALVLALGLGLIGVSVSASNMPGGMLGSFASDLRQALAMFSLSADDPNGEYGLVSFFTGGDLYLGGDRAAKVAFLVDLAEENGSTGPSLNYLYLFPRIGRPGQDDTQLEDLADEELDPSLLDGVVDPEGPDLPDTAATDYAPGQQDEPATLYAPGLQDGPATDYAPGLVKKLDDDEDLEDKVKDKEDTDGEETSE